LTTVPPVVTVTPPNSTSRRFRGEKSNHVKLAVAELMRLMEA